MPAQAHPKIICQQYINKEFALVDIDWAAVREATKVDDPSNATAFKFGQPVGTIELMLNGETIPWYISDGGVKFKIICASQDARCSNSDVKFEDL